MKTSEWAVAFRWVLDLLAARSATHHIKVPKDEFHTCSSDTCSSDCLVPREESRIPEDVYCPSSIVPRVHDQPITTSGRRWRLQRATGHMSSPRCAYSHRKKHRMRDDGKAIHNAALLILARQSGRTWTLGLSLYDSAMTLVTRKVGFKASQRFSRRQQRCSNVHDWGTMGVSNKRDKKERKGSVNSRPSGQSIQSTT